MNRRSYLRRPVIETPSTVMNTPTGHTYVCVLCDDDGFQINVGDKGRPRCATCHARYYPTDFSNMFRTAAKHKVPA